MKVLLATLVLIPWIVCAQAPRTQTIRGVVLDQDSKAPIPGATIIIVGSDPLKGTTTDTNGQYSITDIPTGRYTLKASFIGYEEITSTNVLLMAGKQLELNFELKESTMILAEVVVSAAGDKTELNNDLTTVSGRTFNVDETSRYAGSRNDVSRMAQNFAGVSNVNDARNDIVIRGNSPGGLLWRLNGIDIPSPNHFAAFGSTGGPVGMLNNNTLSKSDFITAAFPATYGNAVSGVFDLQMRNGNNLKREYLGQIGFNGLEFGAEGPFTKGKPATFMVNYRFSTLGVFKAIGLDFGTGAAVPSYQDISFKVNLPTANAGTFSVFGMAGISSIALKGSESGGSNLYGNESQDVYDRSKTGVLGISHSYQFSKNTSYRLTLASSAMETQIDTDSITWTNDNPPAVQSLTRNFIQSFKQLQQSAHLTMNHKFSGKSTIVAGAIVNLYHVNFGDSVLERDASGNMTWRPLVKGSGGSVLSQGYVNWQHRLTTGTTLNLGAHAQHFSLGNAFALEPRAGLKFQVARTQTIGIGVGVHNQIQALPIYYVKTSSGGSNSNEDLGFTRSKQVAVAYDYNFHSDYRVKLETYYQAIDRVPVEQFASSFSMLNAGADFVLPSKSGLVNQGIGRNYGLELTLEKFYSQQFYFLMTSSLYKSEYQGSDQIWRSTAFDGGYIVNALGGKEWQVGGKDKTFGVSFKVTTAGGKRYTPIDIEASIKSGQTTLDDTATLSQQYAPYFRTDIRLVYRVNRAKLTMEWVLDVQNVTNHKNIFTQNFDSQTGTVNSQYQLGIFPVPQFRVLF